ncbi:uncharacterized protein OCT59_016689 [Rhizophagus irregularis]|uniref:uncharacterized protein n=1 Tax=Rhizophagus irregularis TaxID=588596 RepID=UPI00332B61AF|nr:hypothetical protein OCT59_016689 [Rhizophagus irregularis]
MSGPDRIRRILSVIAHQFSYQELQNRLGVSPTTINAARKYATFNGPGCRQIKKPIIILPLTCQNLSQSPINHVKISLNPSFTKEIEDQFEAFVF